ncbi:MAG: DUF1499 domain-containing protein [Hyphomicrobiaceae bacterium]
MTWSWRGGLVAVALILGLSALGTLAAAPLGWRSGWWHYGDAFRTLMPRAAWLGLSAMAVSVLAIVVARSVRLRMLAAVGLAAGAVAAYMPWQASSLRGVYPGINDISTDLADPPAFVATLPARRADGGSTGVWRPETAAVQRSAYADIAPLRTSLAVPEAFAGAVEVAAAMPRWRITARDAAAGRIEASEASRWFGFTDDVVVRVAPDGTGSRIDVRSASRHGRGDFGVNARRVRAYLAALRVRMERRS